MQKHPDLAKPRVRDHPLESGTRWTPPAAERPPIRPAERRRPVTDGVFQSIAFAIVENLVGRLPDEKNGLPLRMMAEIIANLTLITCEWSNSPVSAGHEA